MTLEHFQLILTQPQNAIIKQYTELLKTEHVELVFEDSALEEIAKVAIFQNENSENIGARRLHTVMEKLLEDISYNADEYAHQTVTIDKAYVDKVFDVQKYLRNMEKYII